MPVFALVDVNNFYASCEALFDPKLRGIPLVVLSNNDGCVVARSAEAKVVGVPMGAPWHQLRDLARRHHIVAMSSNYALYADMSNRVVEILRQFCPTMEVYSIDESFLDLAAFELHGSLEEYGGRIRQRIQQWLGLTVCVGIGPTKTLAKLANHCAKKDLAGADAEGLRRRVSVGMARTVQELRGVSCLDLEELAPAKQQIMASRSFGQHVHDIEVLREAVASHIGRAAEKLRAQGSVASAITVFIRTNPFKPQEPQYQPSVTVPLPVATADTRKLTATALRVLERIYRPGLVYHKAGVVLSHLRPSFASQETLFAVPGHPAHQSECVMGVLDAINRKWGRGTLRVSVEGAGDGSGWRMRRGNLSPTYTTRWSEVPVVR